MSRIRCYQITSELTIVNVPHDDAIERWRAGSGNFWIEIYDAGDDERASLLARCGVGEDSIAQMLDRGHAARLFPLDAGVYFEFSTNEKVAMEVAAAASASGLRALNFQKHVGLNVAADAFMTIAYQGVRGGMVMVSADANAGTGKRW